MQVVPDFCEKIKVVEAAEMWLFNRSGQFKQVGERNTLKQS